MQDQETIALISAGAAIVGGLIGGGLGYVGVVRQLGETAREAHRESRRSVYLAYLREAHGVMRESGQTGGTAEQWLAQYRAYEIQAHAVALVGTRKAASAADALTQIFRSMMRQTEKLATERNDPRASFFEHETAIRAALTAAGGAMRADVGPPEDDP